MRVEATTGGNFANAGLIQNQKYKFTLTKRVLTEFISDGQFLASLGKQYL